MLRPASQCGILKFLRRLDQEFPGDIPLHLVMDNYGKHANVRAWLNQHPRFRPHYVPTSSSWLNLVERWFRELTSKRIRRGTFLNVSDLITAIEEFMDTSNRNPKLFVWTATVDSIVEKLRGAGRLSKTSSWDALCAFTKKEEK